ncbi:capsid maturation protease [Arthrobacter phage Altadena]|uniref:Capsid maturation protease n=1 Tax=Arthrobacter phage Altadena TaxID=3059064 RepID=A0AA96HTI4_9CAUD|nr:capsid maturation protease [Arthrobacter phage Altadena]
MCRKCDEVEELLALSEIEEEVILAEAQDGSSWPGATRPLTPAERAAGVRFGEIANLHDDAEAEASGILSELETVIESAIHGAIFGAAASVTGATVLRALAGLNASQPKAVQDAVVRASTSLAELYSGVYARGAAIVLDEAKRQGSKAAALAEVPGAPRKEFVAPAASAAMYPWTRTTSKLQAVLGSPGALNAPVVTRADLSKTLGTIGLDGAIDTARQGINQAHGRGRDETAATLEPEEIWASEILDGATCGPCQAIDGKEYSSLEEARADYPHGGYAMCDGDARCRGTLVYQFPIGNADPPPPPDRTPPPEPAPPAPVVPAPAPGPAPAPAVPAAPPAAPVAPPAAPRGASHNLPEPTTDAVLARPRRAKGQPQRFGALDQLPVKDPYDAPASRIEDAKDTNPEYDRTYKTRVYNNNCTHVTAVYELRRRGYDVTAAPVKGGAGRYDQDFLPFWNNPATGRPPVFRRHPDGAEMTADILANEPDGARGIVSVFWKSGGGHVYNYERIGNEVHYIEAQTGSPDTSSYFADVKPGKFRHFRTDHLEPTDKLAKEAAQVRTPAYQAEVRAKAEADKEKARMERLTRGMSTFSDGKWSYDPPTYRKEGRKYIKLTPEERQAMKDRVERTY